MTVIRTHSTQARGAREFAERLHRSIGHVRTIRMLNVRSSRIKPRRRPPKVITGDTSVLIHYYKEGSMQRLAVMPQLGISVRQLAQVIRTWLAKQ